MRVQKYQTLTFLLVAYAAFMTFYFGLDLLKNGQAVRFWLTLSGETIVIILAFFALRRRDRIRSQRKNNINK